MDLKITNQTSHIQHTPEIQEKNGSSGKNDQRIEKAARDFETLLTTMMMKSMNSTKEKSLFGDESESSGFGDDYFDMVFQQAIASKLSDGKGLGIADMIYKKVTGKSLSDALPKVKLNNIEDLPIKNFDTGIRSLEPSKKSLQRLGQYENFIREASDTYGISENIIKSVILTESAGNSKALSKCNAKGLMQMIDSTASDMGVNNVWDPRQNIMGGTKYLSKMLRQYNGDLTLALASYNAGPGNVDKYNGVPPFEETKSYITRVMSYMNHLNGSGNES